MNRRICIGVGEDIETAQAFINAWHRAERGDSPPDVEERLNFEDMETLLRILTARRWALLRELRREGPKSVRSLAKSLARDYKNVHTDVRALERIGLVSRTDESLVIVPWETVVAELRLVA